MWKTKLSISIVIILALFQSCKNVKEISSAHKVSEKIKTQAIATILSADTINYRYLFTRIDVKVNSEERNISFKMSLKFTKDSAISANISFFNFIIASALIKEDSVFVSNKRKKCFMEKSIDQLTAVIGVKIGYNELQNLLAGKLLSTNILGEMVQLERDNFYVLSTHSDKEIKKLTKKMHPSELSDSLRIIRYFITPVEKKISAIRIDLPKKSISMFVEYIKQETINGIRVPVETLITIENKKIATFTLKYNRTRINEPRKLYFIVPDNYEKCD